MKVSTSDKHAFWRAFLATAPVQPAVVLWRAWQGKEIGSDDFYYIAVGLLTAACIGLIAIPFARRYPRIFNS